MIDLALLLPLAFAPGFAEGADVRGPRPAPELRRALAIARPALDACVLQPSSADVFVDIEVLAAGFVDRAAVFAASGEGIDEPCIKNALRRLALTDRGLEPPTHAVVHLAVRADGAQPRPTPRELAEALLTRNDDVDHCVDVGRRSAPSLGGSVLLRLRIVDERANADVIGGSIEDVRVRECISRALADVRVEGARANVEVAWPLFFPPPRAPAPDRKPRSPWESPTLFQFLGCGGAFQTS